MHHVHTGMPCAAIALVTPRWFSRLDTLCDALGLPSNTYASLYCCQASLPGINAIQVKVKHSSHMEPIKVGSKHIDVQQALKVYLACMTA